MIMKENPSIKFTNKKNDETKYSAWVCTGEKPKCLTINTPEGTYNLSIKSILKALKANNLIK